MKLFPYKARRALKSTLFAMMAAAVFPLGSLSAYGATAESQEAEDELLEGPVSLEVVYGYQNVAKSGRFLPLTITMTNTQDTDFTGTLSVLSMEPDFQGYSSNYEYDAYRYEYPVTIGAGRTLIESRSISLGAGVDQMYVILEDDQGNEIGRKRLKLNLNLETAELFVGVLSDSPEELSYLNHVGINYGTLRTRTIELTAAELPADEMGLDQLDVLLITDYDTGRLSGQQAEAVWEWVQRGGTLLIGTGDRAEDTLRIFERRLLEDPIPQAQTYTINMGEEYATERPEDSEITLTCTELTVQDGSELISSDGMPVLSAMTAGNGTAAVAVYDFGDIGPFCERNLSYIDNLFASLLGEDKVSSLSSSLNGSYNRFWSVQGLINSGNISRLPKVELYVTLAAAYVILAGPGLYFFLKQRELRNYYQPAVALLSLCCTGMVLLMGMTTRFNGPFFTYASIRDADRGSISETTFINMRAPYNKPYGVNLDSSYRIYPLTASPFYNSAPVPEFTGYETAAVTLQFEGDKTRLRSDGIGPFESKYFQMKRDLRNKDHEGFTGEIHAFDGQITGTLTNHYKQPVEKVAVLLYNQMVLIDRMEPEETVQLADQKVIYCPTNFSYALAAQITGASEYRQGGDIRDEEYVQAMERANLLSFYIDNYMAGYHSSARVIGFGQDKEASRFLKDSSYETYGSTLLTSELEVDYEKDGMVYRSAMQKKPNLLSGEYYFANNTIYGQAPVILEYYLGNDLDVEQVSFHQLSEEMAKSLQDYYTVPFVGNMYFYNYNTGDYDLKSLSDAGYSRESLRPYLSPGNTLTVKYVYDAAGDYSWNVMLPVLTVTGRSK